MSRRPATPEEIIEYYRNLSRPRFRHFIREIIDHRTETGVRHQHFSSAKIQVIAGKPFVKHQGQLQALRADVLKVAGCGQFVCDLRLDSDYLDRGY